VTVTKQLQAQTAHFAQVCKNLTNLVPSKLQKFGNSVFTAQGQQT
jgi:hypothetical protein